MLPSLEVYEVPQECPDCGEPGQLVGYCAPCADRIHREKRIQASNDYRREAQFRLDMETVKARTRVHRMKPIQFCCVECGGVGCSDCDGGVIV